MPFQYTCSKKKKKKKIHMFKKKMIHEKANFIELHTQKENISARQKKKKKLLRSRPVQR